MLGYNYFLDLEILLAQILFNLGKHAFFEYKVIYFFIQRHVYCALFYLYLYNM